MLRVNPGSHQHTFAFLLGLGPQRGIMYRLERGEEGHITCFIDYLFQKAPNCAILIDQSHEGFYQNHYQSTTNLADLQITDRGEAKAIAKTH